MSSALGLLRRLTFRPDPLRKHVRTPVDVLESPLDRDGPVAEDRVWRIRPRDVRCRDFLVWSPVLPLRPWYQWNVQPCLLLLVAP